VIAFLLVAAAGRFFELGPSKAQRDSSTPSLDFPFVARADEHLTFATVRLSFDSNEDIEVLVNDERVAELSPAQGTHEIPVAAELLSDRNQLTLRHKGACAAHPGGWKGLRSAGVVLQSEPEPLPDELALLPLPFFDRGYDTEATVPVVLGHPPTLEDARTAAEAAAWFAVDAPIPLDFEAHAGALPDSRAVVLLSSAEDAKRLGLPAPEGPSISMMDHPKHPGGNVKLLVIAGRTPAELRDAVVALDGMHLAGREVRLHPKPTAPPAQPYSAPRWIPSGREVPFSQYPEREVLSHDGNTPGTLSVRFRIAPDLWIWPADSVALDLRWSTRLPPGKAPPRLDVEMNGYFLATLPQGAHEARLRIPREHMRGFNQLFVYVHYPDGDPCAAPREGDTTHVQIDGASVLHVEGLRHFASLPDVSLFAFDGFPFSRIPDLGDTAVVLPAHPSERDLSQLFSIFGQLAQITGRMGTRAVFSDVPVAGKDLLVIGPPPRGWSLPIGADGMVEEREPALDLLGGIGPLLDAHRASAVLRDAREWSAMQSIESPLTKGRTAIVVTGPAPFREFLGYAQSTGRTPDVLLLTGGQRYLFHIGGRYTSGKIDPWTRVSWFFASHWIALLPLLLLGVLAIAVHARSFFSGKMKARLAVTATALLFATAVQAKCEVRAPWPELQRYVDTFVSPDGRVLDQGHTTSEGQAYAMFFAVAANDRALFARLLRWTNDNLAHGTLGERLPAWSWGERRDHSFGVLDENSASDADLWMAYALLEGGRLWSEPNYTRTARQLLASVVSREVRDLPGLGPMLLPGPQGFVTAHGFRLNPSYEPLQLLRRFASANVPGPWNGIAESSSRMLRTIGSIAPDWVLYDPRRGFVPDREKGRAGSYDAIRVYLWQGMEPKPSGAPLLKLLPSLPETIEAGTLRSRGSAPIGFYGALLPAALFDPQARSQIVERLDAADRNGLYGDPPRYFDQNLILFGRGFAEGRFHFLADGALAPAWERQCFGSAR
jgi:endo-1,4-beta-D-glucanase Y